MTVMQLHQKQPEFTHPASRERFMLSWDQQERSLQLVEFDLEKAIASLKSGQPVIPLWLDRIHQQVASRLGR